MDEVCEGFPWQDYNEKRQNKFGAKVDNISAVAVLDNLEPLGIILNELKELTKLKWRIEMVTIKHFLGTKIRKQIHC